MDLQQTKNGLSTVMKKIFSRLKFEKSNIDVARLFKLRNTTQSLPFPASPLLQSYSYLGQFIALTAKFFTRM